MGWRFDDWLVGGEDSDRFSVYKILDSCGRIKYVGCTKYPLDFRLSNHINCTYIKGPYFKFFQAVKSGKTTATIELIKEFDNPFDASELEQNLIANSRGLLNKSKTYYADKRSTYKYRWIMKRGGSELLSKFKRRAIERHNEWRAEQTRIYNEYRIQHP